MKKIHNLKQTGFFFRAIFFVVLLLSVVTSSKASYIIDENTTWNRDSIFPVGAQKSDFYAQSFYSNEAYLTKIGVLIWEHNPEGQVILEIVPANGLGEPDLTNVLFQGTLINPTKTPTWYYERMYIPVNVGQKYFLLIDGYNNMGATGNARIGLSSKPTDTNESVIYSNNNGSFWDCGSYCSKYLAVHIEGINTAAPISIWSIFAVFVILITTTFFTIRKRPL